MAGESQQPPDSSPDPTTLTTEQMLRAVAAERDFVNGKIAVLEQRLDAIDKATRLLNDTVTQVPTDMQVAVGHLRELTEEKLAGVEKVLTEQRRGMDVAEREREKSAVALRIALARAIEEGDRNLRDHIAAQISQIHAAQESAEKLEVVRVNGAITALRDVENQLDRRIATEQRELISQVKQIEQRIAGAEREATLVAAGSEKAIEKAERSAEKQFDEFSKTVEAQMMALRDTVQDLTRRIDKLV